MHEIARRAPRPQMVPAVTILALTGALAATLAGCAGSRRDAGGGLAGPRRAHAEILRAEDRRQIDGALRSALSHRHPSVRAAAVRALGRMVDPAGTAAVRQALADEQPVVRAEAAWALALLSPGTAADDLDGLVADPATQVRARVADGLGLAAATTEDPAGAQAALQRPLAALLADADPAVIRAACYAVGRLPRGDFAVDRLAALSARENDPETAFAATWALARHAGEPLHLGSDAERRAKARLKELASSLDWRIRVQVAAGFAHPADSSDAGVLARLLDDRVPLVRVAATRSFCFIGAPVVPYVDQALADEDTRVVHAAVRGLGRMRGRDVADRLTKVIAYEERTWLRVEAVESMIRADPELAAGIANGLSREDEAALRAVAARALHGRNDDLSLEIVSRLLEDPEAAVRAAAIPVLAHAPGSLVEALGPLADDPGPRAARAIATAAAARAVSDDGARRDEALEVLEHIWEEAAPDRSPVLERQILRAAGAAAARDTSGGEAAGLSLVRRGLDSEHWPIRREAARWLAAHGHGDHAGAVGPAAEGDLESYEALLRWASRPRAAIVTVRRGELLPGRFTVKLDAERAPLAARNFWSLAEKGFYDNLHFHELVPATLVQDGDPLRDGTGDPGFWIRDELRPDRFGAGTLVMAGNGPDTAGSRWFVTLTDQPHLAGRATPFGEVVQNLPGVVSLIQPGDRIIRVFPYEGDGSEPLP